MLLGVGRAPGLLPAFLVVHGFTVAAENVMLPLVVVECFGVAHLARIYGAIMLALLPGGVAGSVFAGWVFDTVGSYWTAFAVLRGAERARRRGADAAPPAGPLTAGVAVGTRRRGRRGCRH